MKTASLLTFLLASATFCTAQQAKVNIQQDQKINSLLAHYKSVNETSSHYRIQVGFGTDQQAQALKTNIDKDYPTLPATIDFEYPSYRVRLGKFKTKLEGERTLMDVRKKYPEAMLLKPKKTTK
ncbi:SPOR domain-containing protein [Arenibacter sp. 6A1]|uniref:SPOR domain-containing protein n=1 Tax=Arenibacter sp. 6A1 TaxID=2720391 RepID=UPI001445CB3D|nr:SPOR domain-containing protein [Arenibacter sp. 6A1]NKI25551.1 SPOR domain-containing protein [Arenibacter sp. 6A1]